MSEPFEIGLTFDDVLLVPRRSGVSTRQQVDTRTQLCRGITLAIPIVSASMDTVTEARMASEIAREGESASSIDSSRSRSTSPRSAG